MNISFRTKANTNNSIEVLSALENVRRDVLALLDTGARAKYENSPLPLIITIIANPTAAELQGAYRQTTNLWSILAEEVGGDRDLYAFHARLRSVIVPKCIESLLIVTGLSEFSQQQHLPQDPASPADTPPVFTAKTPKYSFDDVLLNQETKVRILRALSIVENRDIIFNTWGFSKFDKSTKSIICFYGPAGTGKTMTAEAIGSYLHKKIVHSSYAQIESKWVGEGAKNLHAIFKFAEEHNAVLFFDEADSFLSSRIESTSGSSDKHYNRMSNELFQLLEDFNGCVIFATNLLTDVDTAFKSRIIDSIKFELPDANSRIDLIKKMIPEQFPLEGPISDEQLQELATITEDFSGRDIRKSILLSLAQCALKLKSDNAFAFSYDDFKAGFIEVKEYKDSMAAEEGIIPNSIAQTIFDKQRRNENIFDISIYAMLCDGVLLESEKKLLNELSQNLLGVPITGEIDTPKRSLEDICNEAIELGIAKELIDNVIRVLTSDGPMNETETDFLQSVIELLAIPGQYIDTILRYARATCELSSAWNALDIAKD